MMEVLDWMITQPALTALAIGDIALLLVFVTWDGRNFDRLQKSSGLEIGEG